MAGRTRRHYLYPLTAYELKDRFDLDRALLYGTLPSVYLSEDPHEELKSYVGDYLKEEIMAEALSRNIESFARFLQTAAYSNGEILNFEKIGLDSQVPARTIREYYSILEDTLIGTSLQPFKSKKNRKTVSKSKFFFFDLGVLNSLLERRSLSSKTPEFGNLFESWIFLELRAYLEYKKKEEVLTFWRTQTGQEVDFVLGDQIGIEVKSTSQVIERHLDGLLALEQEMPLKKKIVISRDSTYRKVFGIEIFPYLMFINALWNDEIF
jgi:predicted AAA+ superfamily ATPase